MGVAADELYEAVMSMVRVGVIDSRSSVALAAANYAKEREHANGRPPYMDVILDGRRYSIGPDPYLAFCDGREVTVLVDGAPKPVQHVARMRDGGTTTITFTDGRRLTKPSPLGRGGHPYLS